MQRTVLITSTLYCLNTTGYFVLVLLIILRCKIVFVKPRDSLEDLKVYVGAGRGGGDGNIKMSLKAMLYDCVVWLRVAAGGGTLRTR
jgi:hypothetical protein